MKSSWVSEFDKSPFPRYLIGQLFTLRSEQTDSLVYAPLSVGKKGVTPQLENIAKSLKTDGRKLVRQGDIVINSRADRRGASGLADRDGSVSLIYTVLTPRSELLTGEFAHHLIRSLPFQEEFYRYGTGIVDDLWSTRYERMAQIRVSVPDLDTQKRIANYLDRETAEIDEMVADIDAYVEVLEDKKSVFIQEKLDSSTDSKVQLFKFAEINPITSDFQFVQDGDILPFIPLENVWSDSRADFSQTKAWKKTDSYTLFKRGDILVPKVTPTVVHGRTMIAEIDSSIGQATTEVHVLRPKNLVDSKWLKYNMLSRRFLDSAGAAVYGVGGLQRISANFLQSFKVPDSTIQQQQTIVAEIEAELSDIDSQISSFTQLRDVLVERRSALITEVVTGQREV